MERPVTIIDYDRGNLFSVARAVEACGAAPMISDCPEAVANAERLILPGVGAFGDAMEALRRRGLTDAIHAFIATGRPFLGICIGMQVLFDQGEEFGNHAGLGLIPGKVLAIPKTRADGMPHKVPHIGWSTLVPAGRHRDWSGSLFADLTPAASTYFVHSFTAWPDNEHDRLADAFHNGRRISAAIERDNIVACQFHPEKSGKHGLAILRRFLN